MYETVLVCVYREYGFMIGLVCCAGKETGRKVGNDF